MEGMCGVSERGMLTKVAFCVLHCPGRSVGHTFRRATSPRNQPRLL
jgi:hypothetical protein